VIKSKGGGISLVVGEDIQVEKIGLLVGRTLVGKFLGCLNEWIQLEWAPILGYGPIYYFLAKVWIGFLFRCDKDGLKILK